MVTNIPFWITVSPGTAWGMEPLAPAATMGSKETFRAPRRSSSYTSRAATSRSVCPGRIKFKIA